MPKERTEQSKDVPPEGPGPPLKLLQPRKQDTDVGRDRDASAGIEVLEIVTTVQENLIPARRGRQLQCGRAGEC